MNITAGKYKGTKIKAPDKEITRPTLSKVRMSIFNTLQSMIDFETSSFLDMYSGSGIMALEAISRGFSRTVAIEKNKKALSIIKNNFSILKNLNDFNTPKNFRNKDEFINENFEHPTRQKACGLSCDEQDNPQPETTFKIIYGDSLKICQNLNEKFDIIYIDPPYFSGIYEQSLNAIKNLVSNIVILEHVTDVHIEGYEIIKQKKICR